jgi:serine/threonine protein kinase
LYLECQGITTYSSSTQYYDTLANDVWSLGVILINLVSGRNPWKVANLQDPAFAAFVKQPRRFFRTILPGISKSLDRILIRIFCLNPDKRITLHELRNMVLGCRSFTCDERNSDKPITPPSSQQQNTFGILQCSESLASTMIAYIGDYTDNEDERQPSLMQTNSSNSSITTAAEGPPTPCHGSPYPQPKCMKHYDF